MANKAGTVYVNADRDTAAVFKLSSKAGRLLLPIYCNIDDSNNIDRNPFQQKVEWVKDTRTWKKYWEELVENRILVFLDQNTFMVSPYECYREGINHLALIAQWRKVSDGSIN